MRCFFFDPTQQEDPEQITITGPEARHMSTVLRLDTETMVELFDGQGAIITARITSIQSRKITLNVVQRITAQPDPAQITLIQAMLKGKKMDFLIQKSTELGAHTFQPLISMYCEKRKHTSRQQQRWERIMLEACKQCGRPLPMRIDPPLHLDELNIDINNTCILPFEDEHITPLSPALLRRPGAIFLLIGPEGGLHSQEITTARTLGFTTVTLGQRILRAETAALATVSIVQYLSGNFDPPS